MIAFLDIIEIVFFNEVDPMQLFEVVSKKYLIYKFNNS